MKKLTDKFLGPELPVKLVLFNIIIVCGLVGGVTSFIASLSLEMTKMQILTIVLSEIVGIWCFVLANFQGAMQTAIVGACVTISIFVFPIMFFTGGGVHSGMPIWFVLGTVFSFLLLEGKQLYIILGMQIVVDTACFFLAYQYPQMVTAIETESGQYIDTWQSMMIIALLLGAIMRCQNNIYIAMLKKEEIQNKELVTAREEAERVKSELIVANQSFRELAYTDIMTQLRNRSAFERKMSTLREQKTKDHVIIMLADVNNLKHINDECGHSYGDDAIVRVADCLSACFKEKCHCYRIGGDEFCVISENVTTHEFEQWYNHFETEFEQQVQQVDYQLSIAAGYSEVGNEGVDVCFRDVDAKMYVDKVKMKEFLKRKN